MLTELGVDEQGRFLAMKATVIGTQGLSRSTAPAPSWSRTCRPC